MGITEFKREKSSSCRWALISISLLLMMLLSSGCSTIASKLPNKLDQQGHYYSGVTFLSGKICLLNKKLDLGYEPSVNLVYLGPLTLLDYHFTFLTDTLWLPMDFLFKRNKRKLNSDELCDLEKYSEGYDNVDTTPLENKKEDPGSENEKENDVKAGTETQEPQATEKEPAYSPPSSY